MPTSGGVGDSQWRTDLVAHNSSTADAEITMVLHTEDGDSEIFGTISGSNQAIYENVVDLFGVTGKGTLEIQLRPTAGRSGQGLQPDR